MNHIFAFRVTRVPTLTIVFLILLAPALSLGQDKRLIDDKLYLIPYEQVLRDPKLEAQAEKLQPRTKRQQIWLLNFQIAKDDQEIASLKAKLEVWRSVQQLGQVKMDNLAEIIANIEVRTNTLVEERDKRLKRVDELDDTIAKRLKRPRD